MKRTPDPVPLPLYFQVTNRLREQIMSGQWPKGTKLPTEAELAERFSVSRLTVRKAKAVLEQEGLIQTVQGSGSRVNDIDRWQWEKEPVETLQDIVDRGRDTFFKIHEYHMVTNTRTMAKKLQNQTDRFIFNICGVRYWSEIPLAYVEYYLPFQVGSRIQVDKLNHGPFIPQFEEILGCSIVEGLHTIYPGRAGVKAAEKLNIRPGSLILAIDTVYLNDHQAPVYLVNTKYRHGYTHQVKITRRPK